MNSFRTGAEENSGLSSTQLKLVSLGALRADNFGILQEVGQADSPRFQKSRTESDYNLVSKTREVMDWGIYR